MKSVPRLMTIQAILEHRFQKTAIRGILGTQSTELPAPEATPEPDSELKRLFRSQRR